MGTWTLVGDGLPDDSLDGRYVLILRNSGVTSLAIYSLHVRDDSGRFAHHGWMCDQGSEDEDDLCPAGWLFGDDIVGWFEIEEPPESFLRGCSAPKSSELTL